MQEYSTIFTVKPLVVDSMLFETENFLEYSKMKNVFSYVNMYNYCATY